MIKNHVATQADTIADLIVIGAGPAGLAAALSAKEAGCEDVIVLERDNYPGGILQQCIHNGFGLHYFHEELTGPEYAARFVKKAESSNLDIRCTTMVIDLSVDEDGKHLITTVSPDHGLIIFKASAVILAMGCRERPRGALGIPGSRCAGIMTTGTAQRLVNREGLVPGHRIVILGSGDIGLIMARRLTYEGAKVIACVEIMPYSSGLTRNVVQCLQDYDIPLMLNHTVVDIEGRERVTAVIVAAVDPKTKKPISGTEQKIDCDTLLLSVGLIPENELSRQAGVVIDNATQGPEVDQNMSTSIPGIFACGNVLHVHDLVDYVTIESEAAGQAAAEYIRRCFRKQTEETEAAVQPLQEGAGSILFRAGSGVRGLVPQYLQRNCSDKYVMLYFRPDKIYRQAHVKVLLEEKVIIDQKKKIMTPGEMVTVRLPIESVHKQIDKLEAIKIFIEEE